MKAFNITDFARLGGIARSKKLSKKRRSQIAAMGGSAKKRKKGKSK